MGIGPCHFVQNIPVNKSNCRFNPLHIGITNHEFGPTLNGFYMEAHMGPTLNHFYMKAQLGPTLNDIESLYGPYYASYAKTHTKSHGRSAKADWSSVKPYIMHTMIVGSLVILLITNVA